MLISIVINNYNYAVYLNDCIDSCLSQTYINKEIIVVDDGSIDDSRSIILEYESRIKSVFKSNGGQASAFNACFFASRGDVILFLDSDDMLMPHCLDRISQNWDCSFSKLHFNLLVTGKDHDPRGEIYSKQPLPRGDLKDFVLREGNHRSMPTSGNAFSRSFLNRVMPMPEADWRGHADAYLTNLAPLAGCVGAIDEPLGFYRQHSVNMSYHIVNSRIQIDKIHNSIVRERNTDRLISDYSRKNGLKYHSGALINSYPHLQLVMLHDKLVYLHNRHGFMYLLRNYFNLTLSLFKLKRVSFTKIALIHAWMLLILVAPSKFAEKLMSFAYERGAIFSQIARPRKS